MAKILIGTFDTLNEAQLHRNKCMKLKEESHQKVIDYIQQLREVRKNEKLQKQCENV